jgi:hypothetical protein
MNTEISKFAIKLLPTASEAIKEMTGAMEKLVKWANKKFGVREGPSPQQKREEQAKIAAAAPAGQTNKVSETMVTNTDGGAAMVFRGRKGRQIDTLPTNQQTEKAKTTAPTDKDATDKTVVLDDKDAKARVAEKEKTAKPVAPTPKNGTTGASTPASSPAASTTKAPTTQSASASAPTTAPAPTPTSQADLKGMGLKIKEGDVQATDAGISPKLIELAKKIQEAVPGFSYFSGFNDKFHQENSPSSEHTKGLALDFALSKKPTKEEGAQLASMLKGMGATYVQDEYNNASAKSTGGHFHAAISAANGGILSGPKGGYQPNLTMHGTEAIIPLDSPQAESMGLNNDENTAIMSAQLDRLDELVSVMKNQLSVSTKIMQFAS